MDARIYILMVPGWDEGEETRAERAFISEVEAEAVAKAHPRKCAYVTEVSLVRSSWKIQQAFEDWRSGRAYLDNVGNYRIQREGSSSGPIASWNKEVKRLYEDVVEFDKAAQVNEDKEVNCC